MHLILSLYTLSLYRKQYSPSCEMEKGENRVDIFNILEMVGGLCLFLFGMSVISYYTEYIRNHDGWEYAGIFTDEGISGTNEV